MDEEPPPPEGKLIVTIHSNAQFITLPENRRLLVDNLALGPVNAAYDSEYSSWNGSSLAPSPTVHSQITSSPYLRLTTDNNPKDPSLGFLFGSQPQDCDVLLDQTPLKQFALKVNSETGEIYLKNHCRNGTLIRHPESPKDTYRVLTQKSVHDIQAIDVILSPTRFIRLRFFGRTPNGPPLTRGSQEFSTQNSTSFLQFGNIDMTSATQQFSNFPSPFSFMGGGAQPHSVAGDVHSDDLDLGFSPDSTIGLGLSQCSSAYSTGPFQGLAGFWPGEIESTSSSHIAETHLSSSPLSHISLEAFQQLPTTPRLPTIPGVVESAHGLHVVVNNVQVFYRTAQREWDLVSILRAGNGNRRPDQVRAFRKKLTRLGRVRRETVNGAGSAWISLRDGVLLIRAVGLEAELAGLIALLPESVPADEENFLLRYQRGPLKNHIIFEGQEVAYNPEAGTVKATDLGKIVNVSRRTLFTYFTRHPKMKQGVVKGGTHSGTYILLADVPTFCRAFNINIRVFYLLQERLASAGRGALSELDTNGGESMMSDPEVLVTTEPLSTMDSNTTNPSSPVYEDYFGPNAAFTYQENVNKKPDSVPSSKPASRSEIPRRGIRQLHANTANHSSHGSQGSNHASQGSNGSNVSFGSHASYGSQMSYDGFDPMASSSSREFPSSFYRMRSSLVLDLDLEDYTLFKGF